MIQHTNSQGLIKKGRRLRWEKSSTRAYISERRLVIKKGEVKKEIQGIQDWDTQVNSSSTPEQAGPNETGMCSLKWLPLALQKENH
jgi:hypothetical protein